MYYFLVYHDNTHTEHIQKLLDSVATFGKKFEIIVFPKSEMDPAFVERNKHILSLPRGGGYWLWKPYILHTILNIVEEGDIVFYLDAKYYFTEEFISWVDGLLSSQDMVVFQNKPNEPSYSMKEWCKMDVIEKFGMKDKVFKRNAKDGWAGCILVRKTEFTVSVVKEWLEMCTYENITDVPSQIPNDSCFRDHRHDQSLLSILLHKYEVQMPYFEKRYLQNVRFPYK